MLETFFTKFSFVEIVIIFLTIGIVFVAPIIWIILKGYIKITKRDQEMVIGEDKNPLPRVNPHLTCPHVGDIIPVMTKVAQTIRKITRIEIKDTLSDQLHYAEQKNMIFLSHMTEMYLDTAVRCGISVRNISDTDECRSFAGAVFQASRECINLFRSYFTANHLAMMTTDSFEHYVSEHIDMLNSTFWHHLGLNYAGQIVTKDELRVTMEQYKARVDALFREVLVKGRTIAIDKETEMDALSSELNAYIEKQYGVIPTTGGDL